MGCIYCNFDGKCTLFDDVENRPIGCDKEGLCSVDGDPVPSDNCEDYESDSTCPWCNADFNQDEECTCGDED